MIRVLFLCHGNICRSPMAKYIMNKKISEAGLSAAIQADSAALHTDEIGNGVYPPVKKLLERAGINCDDHRARLASRNDYDLYDYIICMDDANVRDARRLFAGDPLCKIHKLREYTDGENAPDVDDPWYTRDFEKAYAQIEAGCKSIMKEETK